MTDHNTVCMSKEKFQLFCQRLCHDVISPLATLITFPPSTTDEYQQHIQKLIATMQLVQLCYSSNNSCHSLQKHFPLFNNIHLDPELSTIPEVMCLCLKKLLLWLSFKQNTQTRIYIFQSHITIQHISVTQEELDIINKVTSNESHSTVYLKHFVDLGINYTFTQHNDSITFTFDF